MKIISMLKTSEKIAAIFFLILASAGCQTPQSSDYETQPAKTNLSVTNTNVVTVTNYVTEPVPAEDLQDHYGLSLRDAKDKALKLAPGMTQDEVISLLGKPDETSAGTYGTQTQNPWNGITWLYRWGNMNTLGDLYKLKVLSITFEKGSNAWIINNWHWKD
jgi:outer membrane protein assembly factor BamE (lipoprotein component of BamABCDE complex)